MTMHRTSMPPTLRRLIGAQALMDGAHFIALPFLVLHLAAEPAIGHAEAGVILGLYLGLAPLAMGPLADLAGLWPSLRAGLALRASGRALRDGHYLGFAVALVPFWALFARLFGALPVMLSKAGQSAVWASAVILVNGSVGAATVPLLVAATHRVGPRALLAFGYALSAGATACLAFAEGLAMLLAILIGFSIAETATTAGADILTARHADGEAVARRFAILGAGSGLGASAGAPLGLAAASAGGSGFIALALFGLLAVGAAAVLPRRSSDRRAR